MAKIAKLDRKNTADIYALTPLQQGILFHYLKEPDSELYFEQLSLELYGDIDLKIFEEAWNFVVITNEALRTVFRWEKGKEPVQATLKNYPFKPEYFDLTGENSLDLRAEERAKKFDLQEVPFRVLLGKVGEHRYKMIISNHHILFDGWSSGIILKEFFSAYFELLHGKKPLEPIKNRFKEFVKWIYSNDTAEQKKFWQEYLDGFDSPVEFSQHRCKTKDIKETNRFGEYHLTWSTGFKEELENFVTSLRITLATLLYSVRAVLSRKYNYFNDVVFGITVAGRSAKIEGIENIVGLFINTLPLRVSFIAGETITSFLNRCLEQSRAMEPYEYTPLPDIKEYSQPGRQEELFNSIMVLENYPLDQTLTDGNKGLTVRSYSLFTRPHYDLTIGIEIFSGIKIGFYYNANLFDRNTIEKLAGHFENILNFILRRKELEVDAIDMLSDEEKQHLLLDFNDTWTPCPFDKTIVELFEEQVEKSPDSVGLIGAVGHARPVGPVGLTYRELNEQSNRLAGVLIEKGVQQDTIVAIIMERSIEMIIGIFGILKSGGAYLPLDPNYPQERIDYMLKDSGTKLLAAANEKEGEKVGRWEGEKVFFEDISKFPNNSSYLLTFLPSYLLNSSNLAYIIYTSGSTGKPKGVPVEHAGLTNTILWRRQEYKLDTTDNVLQLFSFCFDGSVTSFFTPIVSGSRVVLLSGAEAKDISAIKQVLISEKITHFISVPSLYLSILELFSPGETTFLRIVTLAGESLTASVLEKSKQWNAHVEIVNEYGATENTVVATIRRDIKPGERVTIGKPIANTGIYILDVNDYPAPVGVGGQLSVTGSGVARGYLNNPELTAEKFIDKSFSGSPGGRLFKKAPLVYKTGDLACWLPDGNIEFLGRIDHQVKIRGLRIEQGEIENRLLKHKWIKEVVVLAKEDAGGDKYLAAYFVSDQEIPEAELREYLARELPDYMIPSCFMWLERIPLTPTGKVDRKALPEPSQTLEENIIMPESEMEVKLAGIWGEVLGIEHNKIGIDSNFFRLGGHSLKITRLASAINRELGITISLTQLFKLPTIGVQARFLQEMEQHKKEKVEIIPLRPLPQQEYYDLSYAQRRLWIICQFEEDSIAYNEVGGLTIKGNFNPAAFEQSIQALAQRHEILRTVFVIIDGEPKQKVLPQVDLKLQQEDLRDLKGDRQIKAIAEIIKATANKAFNLEKGPLAVFKLLRLGDGHYFLLVNIHHIINDGWSVGVIKHELNILYDFFNKNCSAYEANEEIPLASLKFQYKDYTLWHNRLIAEGYFDKYKDYWLEKYKDKPTGIELPLDHPRGAVQTFNGGRVYYTIEESETVKLRNLFNQEKTTLFMKLMSLLGILLHKYSGEKDIIMGSPIANRKQPELHHLIGFLVNTLVYRMQVEPGENYRQLLAKVKEESLACYENQDYPFDILVENLGLARDMSRSPLFNVLMAFGDADTSGEDLHFDWTDVQFHDQVEGFNPSVFDLVFFFNEKATRLDCEIMYNSDLFERNSIVRIATNFITLVKHVLGNSEKAIFEFEYIEKEEYETIVHGFNSHKEEFPPLTIQELVEKQVKKSPNQAAVVSPEGWTITYDEINQRANQLAHYLRHYYNIGSGQVIGICIERSLEMIIAVLGVVKSGAAYLSFDPNYPKDRVQHMIQDSRAGLVIIDQSRPDLFDMSDEKEKGQAMLDIHRHWLAIGQEPVENPKIENEPGDAVYVIYTSGSTGMPNGAMLSHTLLSNLIQWQIKDTVIDCSLRCLQFTSINFCVSFQEIFTTLSAGGEVHLIGDIERQDINYLMEFLARRKIGNLYLPFSYLNFLFNLSGEAAAENYLQHIITAGEQLKITGGLKQFLEQNSQVKLHNHYGSSEMHVVTSYTLDAETAAVMPIPPAGKPIANTRIYILDEYEQPVPMGVWGELFVDGSSEVLGYIHNPVLTDKKLVWHPGFSPLSGHRLYRSGDVGRWMEDGNIELKGRKDFQVKIRGFRVELSEIESKILAQEKVRDCVVVVKENAPAEKTLVAYVVGHDLDVMEIKWHLASYLPQYMIPKFMILESLPLMPNGKVDREKLPELPAESENIKPMAARPAPVLTPLRGQVRDFDSLPLPNRSLVNYDKYGKNIGLAMVRHTIALQASRGCPYNCLYCHKIWSKKHVFRSAENIFREVELYYNMGVRRFVFVDDIFNLDVRNSTRFFEMVIKKKLDAHFFFPNGLRSDILTEEYIDLMAAGGTRGIGMALESASPRIQKLLKKNLDLDKLRENAEYLCKKHPRIVLELFLMHGFPTETEEEAIMTLEFLKALHWIDFPYLHILKIFPNTDMAAMAMEKGVSAEAIARSAGMAFHELPETLPFPKSFTLKCQAEFLGDYFLLKERLLDRLPHQMQVLTTEELVEKYNSYLPVEIKTVEDVLEFAGIEPGLLVKPDEKEIMRDEKVRAIDLDAKIHAHFGPTESEPNAPRVLLLDLSQYFTAGKKILYDGVEPPLGLMYLLTYLKQELGAKVNGKIAKSRVDFDSFEELKTLVEEYQPQVIGIRTLTYYNQFFHEAVGHIRQWGFTGPIIAGGPYATSDYTTILKDPHVDVVVLSEGELTFAELISKIIANNNQLPREDELIKIAGLAYVPGNRVVFKGAYCGKFALGEWGDVVSPGLIAAAVRKEIRFENKIEEKLAGIWSELLGVEKDAIGREDNFFELGGHSLKATTMMTRIHKEFNVRVKLIDIFKAPTIRGVAQLIGRVSKESFSGIEPVEKKEYYVTSSAQERMYILQQMEADSIAYNMPKVMELDGELDIQRLEGVVKKLVERHDAFRTSFGIVNDKPVQRIHGNIEFLSTDYTDYTDDKIHHSSFIIQHFIRPFDLSQPPLLRVGLVKLDQRQHLLMVDMHHIISDGVSIDILINDFTALYRGDELPAVRVQYKDYAEWQRREKKSKNNLEQGEYWRKQFEGEIPALELPMDFTRPVVQSFEGHPVNFEIGSETTNMIKALGLEAGATLYMALMAIFNIFLAKVSGGEDIIVGTPAAGRRHADLDKIIGMFVNTLALRNYPLGKKTLFQFLGEVKQKTLEAFENQDYQYEDLVEEIGVTRNAGRNPLLDVLFALQNAGSGVIEIPGLKIKPYEHNLQISKFDLSLTAVEVEYKLLFTFEYSTKLFKQETIERFIVYIKNIVNRVLENKEREISDIEIITEEEKKKILFEFNDTETDYPRDKTIHQLFEEQVSKTPDHVGLVRPARQVSITYRQLNEQSDRLAWLLIEKGILPDTIVGIMLERSIEMITGILGILKAGGAYLPIAPDYPQERIDYMLKDSNAKILINEKFFSGSRAPRRGEPISIFQKSPPCNLAYIIYTSGSTGKPKGVMVEHRNVVRLVKNTNFLEFKTGKRILQTGALEFDASTFEIWGALLNGLLLCLASKEMILNPGELNAIINKYNIAVIWMTAPLFNQMLDTDIDIFGGLEGLLVGGDVLSTVHINRLRERFPHLRVINGYGPTENTTFSTTFSIDKEYKSNIPIGKPIANSTALVVDEFANLQPVGIAGELWVGGDGVARGYLNQPELTAERFNKSYRSNKAYINYKTGDRARWLDDGNIEFLGRIDGQVKIRGFRIELEEIENCLKRQPDVKEAVATANETQSGDKYLCVYLVLRSSINFDFKTYLSRALPDYMVPSYFVQLEKIPLTPNGKVDRKALPKPEVKAGESYSAPRNEWEQKLITIWSQVLGINPDTVGIDDNFFQLGGHSLKATVLISNIRQELGVKIMLAEIFRFPTIREIANFIETAAADASSTASPVIRPIDKKEYYALSINQERLWFIHQMDPQSPAYNMPGLLEFPHEVDEKIIRQVLETLVERHESFRTAFTTVDGVSVQCIRENVVVPLRNVDISYLEPDAKEQEKEVVISRELGIPFDLTHAPLLRVVLFKLRDNHYELVFNMHHIISDGWSMEILKREFYHLYEAYRQGRAIQLSPLEIRYKDFAAWHNRYIEDPEIKNKSHHFWLQILGNSLPPLELPRDVKVNQNSETSGASAGFRFVIDGEIKDQLKKIAAAHHTSLFMVVFSAFNMLLARLSGYTDIVCGIPSAGRELPGLQDIVGFFVNTVILRNTVDYEEPYPAYLEQVNHNTMKALENQYYPLEKILDDLKMKYPTIPVFFNMFNMDIEDAEKGTEKGTGKNFSSHIGKVQDVKFELVIYASERESCIDMDCHYRENLFTPQRVEYMMQQYVGILEALANDPEKKVRDYLFKKERKKFINLGGLR